MRQSPFPLVHCLLQGTALAVLFVALLAACGPPWVRDVLHSPDALVPLLCLMLELSGLFACAVFATATQPQTR
jgi:hypothetical protein